MAELCDIVFQYIDFEPNKICFPITEEDRWLFSKIIADQEGMADIVMGDYQFLQRYGHNGDIKESATIEIASTRGIDWADDTISALPVKIIWDESFIGGGRGNISLFSFNSNWSLRDLFSSIKFDRAEYKVSIS
ncbi:unnamed protein product [Rhizophagus irregularis]|nr:unnamed protein product [Rhizophagus irregularis]